MALNVGDLVTFLRIDARQFDKGAARAGKALDVLEAKAGAFAKVGAKLGLAVLATSAVSLVSALLPVTGALVAVPAAAGAASAALVSLMLAVDGVGTAMGAAVSGDIDAYQQALEELTPSAQRTARAVGDAFFNLRDTAQEAFFAPVAREADVFAAQLGGPVRAGIGSVAGALGELTAHAAALMSEARAVAGVTALFDETAAAIDNSRAGFGIWLQGLGDLMGVFIPGISQAGQVVGDGLARWGQWMSEIAASGQALAWFETAKQTMSTLWGIASNLTSALYGIFTAADGSNLLTTIESLTAQFAAWVHSAQGQEQIIAVMGLLGDIALSLMTILPGIAQVLGWVAAGIASLPGPAQDAIALFGALAIAFQFLGGLAIVQAAITAGRWALAFGSMAVGAAGAASRFLVASGQILLAAGRITLMLAATAARVVGSWLLMGAQALLQGARMAAGWVLAMGPVGWVVTAVGALAALIAANWDSIVAWTKSAFESVARWLQVPWQWVKEHWSALQGMLTAPITAATGFIGSKKDQIVGFFRDLPGRIHTALSSLSNFLLSPFRTAFNAIAGLWNNSLGSIRWQVPDWVPSLGGNSLGFPSMPYLADGGVVRQAGLAMVGERGPEVLHLPRGAAVSPLDRFNNGSAAQVHNDIDVTVRLGDREIRDIVGVEITERNRATRRRALAGATA